MQIDIVPLPSLLEPRHVTGRTVVIFDVLRATTCMAAALQANVNEIRVYREVEEARDSAMAFHGKALLAGERQGERLPGFDLGNSPGDLTPDRVAGRTLFMTTTNGTQAIAAAHGAAARVVAAFVNLQASADYIPGLGHDVTLLCAGTDGERAGEDEAAAEALRTMLRGEPAPPAHDPARLELLRNTLGGRNVRRLGLDADIDFAATVGRCDIACIVDERDIVRRA